MSTTTVPTPRALLTDLITTLSTFAPIPSPDSTNPLQNAPAEVRSLFTTLHIIFPHLLLPALDLLDRQLVTRVIQRPPQRLLHQANVDLLNQDICEMEKENTFYMVQSSQLTGRQKRQKSYVVRLCAWNCTCASFVFSAFPPETSNESTPYLPDERFAVPRSVAYGKETEGGEKWEFGGASTDGKGKDGGAVPACKHLLAAVLADRWPALGGMATNRWLGREEMAGLVAGF